MHDFGGIKKKEKEKKRKRKRKKKKEKKRKRKRKPLFDIRRYICLDYAFFENLCLGMCL